MATGQHHQTEISRYGPTSTKIQATQTLLVPTTQIPTQLMSHEVHQFTQLINHDSVEHVGGDTMVNDSDPEGSGNTVVLHDDDDDDDDALGEAESGSPFRGKAGSSLPDQRDDDPHVTPPCKVQSGSCENSLHVERHDFAPSKLIDVFNAPHVHRDLPHSDATTEEGDVENIGYLDADAESQPPHFNATIGNKGVYLGEKTSEIVQPGVANAQDNLASQKTPETALVADTTGKKSSQSRCPSIASVRAESLRASGLRAASRSASGSAGKDDGNLDLNTALELTRGMLNGELKKPLEAPEVENLSANKAADFDSMQSSPKATLPFDGMMAHSPRMSTSRSKSKGVSLGRASQQHALEQKRIDSDAKIELNTVEGLSCFGSAMLGVNVKVQSKQSSSQKARKLVFDFADTSPTTSMNMLEDGGGNADPKALTEHDYVLKKPISVIDAPARERHCSLPAGLRAVSTNLSYLESQEPGEESQANALNIVDKLVWLDATCMSDDVATSPVPQDGSVKHHTGAKGRQSLAQAAQMKTVHDKLDVFDWEDSQADEGISLDTKQVPASMKAQKRHLEAYEPMTDRKKRATPHQQKIEITLCMDKTGDNSGKEKGTTPDVGKTEVPNVEPSSSNQPHILLTTRLRNIKAESRPSVNGRKRPGLRSEPRKHNGKEKQTDESVKNFEPEQQQGGDDIEGKVEQACFSIKNKQRNRTGEKKLAHESGKELESEQQKGIDRKGRKVWQADSLSAKVKREPLKTSEVGPQIQGHLVLAERTSQDDAAPDIWIEAFTNDKNKTPAGSSVEVIKFRKRRALHEDTRQDSKKCRTTEPATVSCDKHQNMLEKEKTPIKENRVKPGLSIQQAPKDINAAAIPQNKGRRVSTRFSQGENQDIKKEEDKMEEQLILKTKQKLKKPRIADASTLSQVQGRRFSTRNSQGEYQDTSKSKEKLMEEEKAEGGLKTRQDPKQCKTADVALMLPVKSREVSTRGSGAEHMEAENAREDDMLRGPKTRSRVQDVKDIVAASNAKKGIRARNAAIKCSTTKATANGVGEPSLSRGAMQADFDTEKPSIKTGSSKKKESPLSHRHLTSKLTPDAHEIEANSCKVGSSGLLSPPLAINGSVGALAGGPKKSKRRGESSDVLVLESTKAGENSGSRLKERDADKSLLKMKDLGCKKGDVSSTILSRRTRSSLCDGGSQNDDSVDPGKDTVQIQGDPTTDKLSLQKRIDFSDAKKGAKQQVSKSATRTTKSISQKNKNLEMLNSSNSVDEGRRRKRESGCIRVLFSHSLTEETIKHQKKILAKLGGQLAISASDCTHFVSNGFTRSQNMLISMAAGKEVVTTLWLESCGQAHYFVDEKSYIPQDVKKEKEFGFSMTASLASARRKPLLKGVNVLVCPNTVPEPAVLKAIVQSAGGQVADVKLWSSHRNKKESNTLFIIIANEKDFDFCVQFCDKGLKVYSEELLLHGIVTQTLDYSRNLLFENFKQQKGPR